ncbi:hypothetical protein [Novosphingobium sp.]|uniref:hypothetical protein n=1 Tax=Novosphingobium sp. TaxID=1874826 RepID=UPI002626EE9F|nr:hypothetical protein [Novosphingobium sp.]
MADTILSPFAVQHCEKDAACPWQNVTFRKKRNTTLGKTHSGSRIRQGIPGDCVDFAQRHLSSGVLPERTNAALAHQKIKEFRTAAKAG